MIYTTQIPWRSACGRAHVEERSGMFWCYLDGQHVGTQLHLAKAVKLLERKMGEG